MLIAFVGINYSIGQKVMVLQEKLLQFVSWGP